KHDTPNVGLDEDFVSRAPAVNNWPEPLLGLSSAIGSIDWDRAELDCIVRLSQLGLLGVGKSRGKRKELTAQQTGLLDERIASFDRKVVAASKELTTPLCADLNSSSLQNPRLYGHPIFCRTLDIAARRIAGVLQCTLAIWNELGSEWADFWYST